MNTCVAIKDDDLTYDIMCLAAWKGQSVDSYVESILARVIPRQAEAMHAAGAFLDGWQAEWMPIHEMAKLLGCRRPRIYAMVKAGRMPPHRLLPLGRYAQRFMCWKRTDVDQLIAEGKLKPAAASAASDAASCS